VKSNAHLCHIPCMPVDEVYVAFAGYVGSFAFFDRGAFEFRCLSQGGGRLTGSQLPAGVLRQPSASPGSG